jgi:hypothetical protein
VGTGLGISVRCECLDAAPQCQLALGRPRVQSRGRGERRQRPDRDHRQLVFSGGTQASFTGLVSTNTLTVAGGPGDDAVVEEGSKAILGATSFAVAVNIASGAHSTIYGDVEIRGLANNRFQAIDPSGIVFQSTGRAPSARARGTTPFGNGTGASGLNSVSFLYGSRLIAQAPFSVFGATAPSAVVKLGPGSRFRMDVAFNPDVSGRTMGDFEYNVPGGISAFTEALRSSSTASSSPRVRCPWR